MSVTIKYYLDKRRSVKNGTFPVKIRITCDRESRLYKVTDSNGISRTLSPEGFEKIVNEKRLTSKLIEVKSDMENEKYQIHNIIKKITSDTEDPSFTWKKFNEKYRKQYQYKSVAEVFNQIILEKRNKEKIGTASSYNDAFQALIRYHNCDSLKFKDIDDKFLEAYERHLIQVEEKTANTVGVYMRTLRVAYNKAIQEEIVPLSLYPFSRRKGDGKYCIPNQTNKKRSLTIEDIEKIKLYTPLIHSGEWDAKNYFLFSYYLNGMNFVDISELKKNNYDGEYIEYFRKKTQETTKKNGKSIRIYIRDPEKNIMSQMQNNNKSSFLFPILDDSMNEEEKRKTRQQFIKTTNKYLKRIAEKLNLSVKNISTYYARHTWATRQNDDKTDILTISESLGHRSIETTRLYITSLNEKKIKELNKNI